MKKTLTLIALSIVTLVVGAVVYLYFSFGSLVKDGVENYAPRFTQTKVTLGGVEASLFGGEVGITDLFIGNPKGFDSTHAFKVARVAVTVDRDSLTSDLIRIREIIIEAPDIIYEKKGRGTNLETIQKNVAAAAGGKSGTGKSNAAGDKDEGPRLRIDNLYIRNAKVAFSAGFLGGRAIPLPVPDIHIKDIGKGGKGAKPEDAAKTIMDRLTGSVTRSAAGISLDSIRKQTESITKGAGDTLEGVTKGLKGLFGK